MFMSLEGLCIGHERPNRKSGRIEARLWGHGALLGASPGLGDRAGFAC